MMRTHHGTTKANGPRQAWETLTELFNLRTSAADIQLLDRLAKHALNKQKARFLTSGPTFICKLLSFIGLKRLLTAHDCAVWNLIVTTATEIQGSACIFLKQTHELLAWHPWPRARRDSLSTIREPQAPESRLCILMYHVLF